MGNDAVSKVLGTVFEMSLRALLMMEANEPHEMSADAISACDFIAVYGADFCLLDENLHGCGVFRFGEFASRGGLVKRALKELVLEGLADANATKHGFTYALSRAGKSFCESLKCEYAQEYRIAAREVRRVYGRLSDIELYALIQKRAMKSIKEV